MKQIKIEVPKGHEIDLEKSNLKEGIVKFKVKLPKSWEELKKVVGYYVDDSCNIHDYNHTPQKSNRNTFVTEEQAKASIALAQLSQLREVYRQGWEPDWTDSNQKKYCLVIINNKIVKITNYVYNSFLSFQSFQIRDLFLKNFRDLIEQAKPLMS